MNDLRESDADLLQKVKVRICEISGLGPDENWSHKDFDFLIFYINDKTGINLSLSTVKRIWNEDFKRLPHITTLNALSQIAFELDWNELKKQQLIKTGLSEREATEKKTGNSYQLFIWLIPVVLICITGIILLQQNHNADVVPTENILFEARPSSDGKIPNSVIFKYDIGDLQVSQLSLQQNWDPLKRITLDPSHNIQTDIYYTPGYYKAKLIGDDKILKEIPVHITYDGWFHTITQQGKADQRLDNNIWQDDDLLSVDGTEVESLDIDVNQPFLLTFFNSREFNIDGDDFQLSTSLRLDSLGPVSCPGINLIIKGEFNYLFFSVGKSGCESNFNLKCSEKIFSGKQNDLTPLAVNVFEWLELNVQVKDQQLTIIQNQKETFSTRYDTLIGPIKEITYMFNGPVSIRNLNLSDTKGNVAYHYDFATSNS